MPGATNYWITNSSYMIREADLAAWVAAGLNFDDVVLVDDLTVGDDVTLASGSVLTWATDTNLYRSAADTLATDDAFSAPGVRQMREATMTETAAAGTYTSSIAIPDGSVIDYVAYETTATWANSTAALDLGYTGALTAFVSAADVKTAAAGGVVYLPATNKAPVVVTTGISFVAKLVAAGSSGTTGRTRVFVGYSVPQITAATKV